MDESNGEFRHPPRKKRGRPSKVTTNQDPGMETANSYESLTDESVEFHLAKEALRRKSPTAKTVKLSKLPPITVFNIPITQIKNELAALGIQGHEIKITKYGTKIFASTNEHFKQIKNFFITNKKEFYTHTMREEQTNKFVIHGLHDIDVSEISNELISKKINPCDIKKLVIKKPRQETQLLYLVYFKKNQLMKISDLRNIRTLSYIRIRWEYYQSKKTGPIQCNNCMNFGHGALNCHLKTRCVRCGDEHSSKICPLIVHNGTDDNKIPEEFLKCANCDGNHSAKYQLCPKRAEYVKVIHNIRNRNKNTTTNNVHNQQKHFQDAPQLLNANFPSINKEISQPWKQSKNISNNYSKQNHSRAFPRTSTENELFSTSEMLEIIKELIIQIIIVPYKIRTISRNC